MLLKTYFSKIVYCLVKRLIPKAYIAILIR